MAEVIKNQLCVVTEPWIMRQGVEFPVITIDDDAILPADLFESLWESHLRHPNCIIASRTHRIFALKKEGGLSFAPYASWEHEQSSIINKPSFDLFPTGLGGVLYPVGCLPKCTFNAEAIRKTCLYGDDLWLKVMEVIAKVSVVDCGYGFVQNLVDGSQEVALCHENLSNNRNNEYLQQIFTYVDSHKSDFDVSSEDLKKLIINDLRN